MRKHRLALRIGGAMAAGTAAVAISGIFPAVGAQSPPVGGESPPVGGNTPAKVAVCHKAASGNQKTMLLPQQAAQAHMGHGDTAGPCPGDTP